MYRQPKNARKRTPRCPYPNCPANEEPYIDPWEAAQCTLNKPLWIVIPPEGIHLSCPVHPEGHHIYGHGITWMNDRLPDPPGITPWERRENNLPDRKNEPYCIGTGFTGKDTFKFSM
jgi:hypothetical protein